MPLTNALIAQFVTPVRNDCESGHVCETQSARQIRSNIGGPPPPKPMQPNTQVRLVPHELSEHMPQSAGQFVQVSNPPIDSQTMLPQNEQVPQSTEQLAQSSVPRHRPSPQLGHAPQSLGQVKHVSPMAASQLMSPQRGHAPQSAGQVMQSSPSLARQNPSSQVEHVPQSAGQLLHDSVDEHMPSPQVTQSPQSSGQVSQRSVA